MSLNKLQETFGVALLPGAAPGYLRTMDIFRKLLFRSVLFPLELSWRLDVTCGLAKVRIALTWRSESDCKEGGVEALAELEAWGALEHLTAAGDYGDDAHQKAAKQFLDQLQRIRRRRATAELHRPSDACPYRKELPTTELSRIVAAAEASRAQERATLPAPPLAGGQAVLLPWQGQAVAWMLAEEAAPGGLARHQWVILPPVPDAKRTECRSDTRVLVSGVTGGLRLETSASLATGSRHGSPYDARCPVPARGGIVHAPPEMDAITCTAAVIVAGSQPGQQRCEVTGGTLIVALAVDLPRWVRALHQLQGSRVLTIMEITPASQVSGLCQLAQYDVVLITPVALGDDGQNCCGPLLRRIQWHRLVEMVPYERGDGQFLEALAFNMCSARGDEVSQVGWDL
eukprot:gene10032-11875_t